jgi:hypothetical protein
MENAVDKNFDRLEIWTLRNVLCLPRGEEELVNWVRLGHYEVSSYHVFGPDQAQAIKTQDGRNA